MVMNAVRVERSRHTSAQDWGNFCPSDLCAAFIGWSAKHFSAFMEERDRLHEEKKKNMDMEIKCCLTQLVIELCQWTFGLKIHYLSWMNIFRALNSVVGRHNQTIDGTRKKKNVSIVISCWALFNLERNQTRF